MSSTVAIIWKRQEAPCCKNAGGYSQSWPNKPAPVDLALFWHRRAIESGTFTSKAAAKWAVANLVLKVGEVQARRLLREAGIIPNPRPPKKPKVLKLPESKAA